MTRLTLTLTLTLTLALTLALTLTLTLNPNALLPRGTGYDTLHLLSSATVALEA